jgi:large subunit ribosomal protein L25
LQTLVPKELILSSTLLELTKRSGAGTTAAKALRRTGQIPATLYGHNEQPHNVAIALRQITELLRTGAEHHLIDITLDGGRRETALVRGVQRDPITGIVVHADILRVSSDESIKASIPLNFTGTAPGVKNGGGILDMVLHHIEVSGPAASLPESIEVDISKLEIREHLTAAQLNLPSGFTLVTAPEAIAVSVEPPRVPTADDEAAAPVAPAASTPA